MTDTQLEQLDAPIPTRIRLAALWSSVMFLYIYVDILNFFKPGTVADILDGRVWEFDVSAGWAFGAMALMSIPCMMPALSTSLMTCLASATVRASGFSQAMPLSVPFPDFTASQISSTFSIRA